MIRSLMRHFLLPAAVVLVVFLTACTARTETTGTQPTGSSPDVQWFKNFGCGGRDFCSGNSIAVAADGGYVICATAGSIKSVGGETYVPDKTILWLIKTDTDGNELWDKTLGETTNGSGNSVEQTTDGGYILCGKTQPNSDGISAVWLIKTDGDGNRLWDKTFTSGDKVGSWGNYAQQVTDGGYIVCGVTGLVYTGEAEAFVPGETKAWLIKTDKDGNKVWDKTFGDEGWSAGNSVEQTTDGGYIICGDLLAFPELRTIVWLIKTDKDGNKLWDKKFGGKEPYSGQTVRQTADGGYIICGIKFGDNSGGKGAWLIKTKANGNKLWDKTFNNDVGNAVQQAADGGYIICGMRNSAESANADALLFKVDADGNKLWDKILTGEKWAAANSIQQTKDGGYAVIIGSSSGILLYKMAAAK